MKRKSWILSAAAAAGVAVAVALAARAKTGTEVAVAVSAPLPAVTAAEVKSIKSAPREEITGALNPAKELKVGFEVAGRLAPHAGEEGRAGGGGPGDRGARFRHGRRAGAAGRSGLEGRRSAGLDRGRHGAKERRARQDQHHQRGPEPQRDLQRGGGRGAWSRPPGRSSRRRAPIAASTICGRRSPAC